MSLYASVCTCNNTVVMRPLFIELIVSFCVKIAQGKFMSHRENSGKTQGFSFCLECGHPALVCSLGSTMYYMGTIAIFTHVMHGKAGHRPPCRVYLSTYCVEM